MKRGLVVFVLVLSVFLIVLMNSFILGDSNPSSNSEWPMFGRQLNHTSYTSALGVSNISTATVNKFLVGDQISSSPAVSNGYVYVASWDNKFYQLNASNVTQEIARYNLGTDVYHSSPAVANGYVYIGANDNKLYQFNASDVSQLITTFTGGDTFYWSSPAVSGEYVYIGCEDGKIYQLNASNVSQEVFSFTASARVRSSPAVANGYVYVGSDYVDKLYQLNASNISHEIASYSTEDDVYTSSPAVANGYVYVGSDDRKLYQLDASNVSNLIASYETGGDVNSPAVANGYVYVSSEDRKLYQLDASNVSNLIASYETGGQIISSPAVTDNYVYFGSNDKKLYQLDASDVSNLIGTYSLGLTQSSPAVAGNSVYIGRNDFGSDDGNAYLFQFINYDSVAPLISFISPTPTDGSSTGNDYVTLNTTITDDSETSAWFDWNRSLVGYWTMGDYYNTTGIYDNSSYSHFAEFKGTGFDSSSITTGKRGSALDFDGVDDYVEIADDESLDLTNSFSVSVWVNANDILGPPQGIITKGSYSLKEYDDDYIFEVLGNGSSWNKSGDVGTDPYSLAVYDGKLYVSNRGSDDVYVYDGSSWSTTGGVGTTPYGLAVYDGKLYVANYGSDDVYVYDGSSWSTTGGVGDGPLGLAVYDGKLYVSNFGSDDVYVYDGTSWSKSGDVGSHPYGLAAYDDKLYVANYGSDDVYVFNGTSWSKSGDVGTNPYGLAAYDDKLYVSSFLSDDVYVYDGTSWSKSGYVGSGPSGLAVYDGKLYVANQGSDDVSVYDGTSWSKSGDVDTDPFGLAVYDGKLYVANRGSDDVYVYSTGESVWASKGGGFEHVTGVVNESEIKLYVNGVEQSSTSHALEFDSNDYPLLIGKGFGSSQSGFFGGNSEVFNGLIDEVMIFNRVLSEQEIKALYDNSVNRLYNGFSGLSSGTYDYSAYAIDSSGNLEITSDRQVIVDLTSPPAPTPSEDDSDISVEVDGSDAQDVLSEQQLTPVEADLGIGQTTTFDVGESSYDITANEIDYEDKMASIEIQDSAKVEAPMFVEISEGESEFFDFDGDGNMDMSITLDGISELNVKLRLLDLTKSDEDFYFKYNTYPKNELTERIQINDSVLAEIVIKNMGTLEDIYTLEIEGIEGMLPSGEASFSLLPRERAIVKFNISAINQESGDYFGKITLTPVGSKEITEIDLEVKVRKRVIPVAQLLIVIFAFVLLFVLIVILISVISGLLKGYSGEEIRRNILGNFGLKRNPEQISDVDDLE